MAVANKTRTSSHAKHPHRVASHIVAVLTLLFSMPTQAQVTTYCCDAAAEATYLADLATLVPTADVIPESFESGPWVPARTIIQTSVTSQGITWSPLSTGGLRTGTGGGDVHDGSYIMYALDFGNPPSHPVPDGFIFSTPTATMHGVGGWFRGTGGKLSFIVDGDANRVDFTGVEAVAGATWKFLGFIDSTAFSTVRIQNVDEVGNETNIFWADDFRLAAVEGPGVLQFDPASYSVAENGSSVTLTVTRSGGSVGAVSVDYASSDGTATASTDYAVTAGTLNFPDGVLSQTIAVPILNDTTYEGDETFSLNLTNATGGAVVVAPTAAVITITEDDPVPPAGSLQFDNVTYTVAENIASVQVTVTRTGGSFGAVSVVYSTSDGSATASTDYFAESGLLSFADGVTSQSFDIAIINDTSYEGDESFGLALSAVSGGASLGTPATATVTITEDDPVPPAGSLQFSAATYAVAENGASQVITVARSGGSYGTVTVDYTTSNGTATAGSDYQAATGTLTFNDGVTSQTFSVPILDDVDYEGDETVNLGLSNAGGGASLGAPTSAVLSIIEDDAPPPAGTLQFSGASYVVAENGASVLATVTRTGGSFGAVSVDYAAADGSATVSADYGPAGGTLNFADGVLSQTFPVTIIDDTTYEGDETFSLNLSNATGGASLGAPSTATVTITENDPVPPAGSLQFSGATYAVAEDGISLLVTVTRTGGSFGTVGIDYASSDGSATAGSDYAAASGTLSFANGVLSQTFSVAVLNDATYEGDETFSLGLSNVTGGATLGTPAVATVTIARMIPGRRPAACSSAALPTRWLRMVRHCKSQ